MDATAETSLIPWSTPECPYTIAYSPRVLDDIRLAVVDAFFSLPKGGVEIGGILLGRREERQVKITGHAALECEHAFGPSFTLSANDHAKLASLTAAAGRGADDDLVIGWYHSHTRSEIFFSAADQEIHRQFFPELWQIALVLKPHPFEPTRAGFFFRNADGSFDGESSRREFVLQPMTALPTPSHPPEPSPARDVRPREQPPAIPVPPPAIVLPIAASRDGGGEVPAAEPAAVPVVREPAVPHFEIPRVPPIEPRVEVPVPGFAAAAEAPSRKWWPLLLVVLGSAAGAAAYQTRDLWWPRTTALFEKSEPAPRDLALTTIDEQGQLQIRWDSHSDALRDAPGATLVINDGFSPLTIALTPAQLQNGSLTFARQTERVDVTLKVPSASGPPVQAVSTFFGKLPPPAAPSGDAELRADRDRLAKEAEKLKNDLSKQAERTRRLEKSMESIRTEMRRERLGRMQRDGGSAPGKK